MGGVMGFPTEPAYEETGARGVPAALLVLRLDGKWEIQTAAALANGRRLTVCDRRGRREREPLGPYHRPSSPPTWSASSTQLARERFDRIARPTLVIQRAEEALRSLVWERGSELASAIREHPAMAAGTVRSE